MATYVAAIGQQTGDVHANCTPSPVKTSSALNNKERARIIFSEFVGEVKNGLQQSGWTTRCNLKGSTCSSNQTFPRPMSYHSRVIHIDQKQLVSRPFLNSSTGVTAPPQEATNGQEQTVAVTVVPTKAIWYNRIAADYFQKVFTSAHDSQGLPDGASTIQFPNGSMIAVPAWNVLYPKSAASISVPIFNPRNKASLEQNGIDTSAAPCPRISLTGPIPKSCFYQKTIQNREDVDFYQLEGLPVEVGDTLLLMGVHIIEMNDNRWTWATFWWQRDTIGTGLENSPCAQPANCQLTSAAPWNHYVMDTVDLPDSAMKTIEPVFNPYLDDIFPNGPKTNCVVCHSFAASPMINSAGIDPSMGASTNISEDNLNIKLLQYLNGKKCTNMLWTLQQALDYKQTISAVSNNK